MNTTEPYKIARAPRALDLAQQVNVLAREGYQPTGEVFYDGAYYNQPMWRPEPPPWVQNPEAWGLTKKP